MGNFCGIWLTHDEAVIVKVNGETVSVEEVSSPMERHHRSTGGKRGKVAYVHRSVNSTAKLDQRRKNDQRRHYLAVKSRVAPATPLLVLGPGQAKVEFVAYLESFGRKGQIKAVKPSKRMTKPQLVALVKAAAGSATRDS